MKEIQFTTDELKTLVWALESKSYQIQMENLKNGKPIMNEPATRLNNMYGQAYQLLTQALEEECKDTAPI